MSFSDDKMLIMPAVDIKNGKCVQLVQGKPGTEQIIIENPQKVAQNWEELGAEIIHVIDLDGAFGNPDNIKIVQNILKEVSVPIQLGGGIRNQEYAKKLLDSGVERLILGTMAIENPEIITSLSKEYGKDRIMVALDSKDSLVVIKGWREKTSQTAPELGKILESKGAGSILFTNVNVEGLLGGFYTEPLVNLLDAVNIPVVYSGGITSLDDLQKLRKTQVKGVVIGSALYKGKIDFEEALKFQD
ncbi:MAG: 1-(5-phosphoribosyl)-5-[(5-phosphoribosylamino)methylideneamino]imidazole-4-carboxamide isomerase [Euryarchaeota archaeon]|nr:1-(5-phosphoribosyl)-5-[(5-phosphoribosylamino)methylideneamino]imidazole-4-carboxamide isomerase [Euryarchaeota archaeon]MBU4608871.1 1-(5-phosphoribosyl)-5-[(5-phosphoribosylamino)methylideneamino]imidazole-4-carboxamide isomerase [Euryarchaeota archaeon]MBV1729385.1 1-(5-phosphoribosyl)-5-[(5-phosphoribosylamino)methylideneamino]imidazole-4-carboxamide isomerase [Methanobacterium sp.]MBV1756067.1 1-(5-phosphoribosyl)-5-[(5-phosphoribosylamino)methylideneamino]imidazole-4-carboxamide isomer